MSIAPVPLLTVESDVNVTAPKFIAVLVVAIVPDMLVPPVTAVVTKPPVKVSISLSLPLPNVTPPVLINVVSLVIVASSFKATA